MSTEICEGIRGAVNFCNTHGFLTTDSGDGSHFRNGMEGAMEEPMVAMSVSPGQLVEQSQRLLRLLIGEGCSVSIEAAYFPDQDVAIILVYGQDLLNLGG